MLTLSHVHQLFGTDTCHAYLRTPNLVTIDSVG